MRRFHFTLEALLQLRKRKEDEVKRELAHKNREISQMQAEVKRVGAEIGELQRDSRSARSGTTISVTDLRTWVAYRHKLMHDLAASGRRVEVLRGELGAIRTRLIQATKETRAVEILKDNRFAEWKKEYNSQQQEFTDDVSQKLHAKRTPLVEAAR